MFQTSYTLALTLSELPSIMYKDAKQTAQWGFKQLTSRLGVALQATDTTSGFTLIEEDAPIANGHAPGISFSPSQSRGSGSGMSGSSSETAAPSVAEMHKSLEQQSAAVSLAVAQVFLQATASCAEQYQCL